MMKGLASFVLRGHSQSILVVVGTAVLAMLFPPLSIISGAALGLVTLRNGARYGLQIMLGATLFVGALAYFSLGNVYSGLSFLALLWLPLWGLTIILREMRSLSLVHIIAGGLGVIGVVVAYLSLGDVTLWWRELLLAIFEPAMQSGGPLADRAAVETILAEIAQVMTGIVAAAIVINALLCLYLARAWQAILFNPGGFGSEFHELRLGRGAAIGSLVIIVVSLLPLGTVTQLADEVLIVILALYVLQGLALAHAIIAKRKMHMAWLVGVYLLVFFIMPQLVALIAVIGLIDSWLDFRHRVVEKTN